MPNRQEQELIHLLIDDVDVLSEISGSGAPPSPQVARTTIFPILRRWICEQQFHLVQKILTQKNIVRFEFWENPAAIEDCQQGLIETWIEMVDIGGLVISPTQSVEGKSDITRSRKIPGAKVRYPSHRFFTQKVIYWQRRFYRRCDLLKIYANKRGGTHFDQSRKDGEEIVDQLGHFFGLEIDGLNFKMLNQWQLAEARSKRDKRVISYDAIELLAIDTAKIFADAVRVFKPQLVGLVEH
jgi:hypothetical protein